MDILNQHIIDSCTGRHASSKKAMMKFFEALLQCQSKTHTDLIKTFPSADYVGNNRYVFDIQGNRYRVICVVIFIHGAASIRFAGTHAEYDKINASTI